MKKILLYSLLLILLYSFKTYGQVERILQQLKNPGDKTILVAAHRGDWRNAPENSLPGLKLAMEEGVDIIEVDLKMSKDSVLVILHDQTLNRSTTGKGKPSEFTLAELKRLRLRDGLGVPANYQIPTLEEVMKLAKGKVLVNLDHSSPFFREAYQVLKKTGTINQAIFKSDEPYEKVNQKYGSLLDSILFMPVIETDYVANSQQVMAYQKALKPFAFELVFSKDTVEVFRDNTFIRKAARIWVNSLWPDLCGGHSDDLAVLEKNTAESWGWLIAHGASIIQTDRPKELLAYLRKQKLHK